MAYLRIESLSNIKENEVVLGLKTDNQTLLKDYILVPVCSNCEVSIFNPEMQVYVNSKSLVSSFPNLASLSIAKEIKLLFLGENEVAILHFDIKNLKTNGTTRLPDLVLFSEDYLKNLSKSIESSTTKTHTFSTENNSISEISQPTPLNIKTDIQNFDIVQLNASLVVGILVFGLSLAATLVTIKKQNACKDDKIYV